MNNVIIVILETIEIIAIYTPSSHRKAIDIAATTTMNITFCKLNYDVIVLFFTFCFPKFAQNFDINSNVILAFC